jgi:uncharacterized lipoprotein YbaY/heat shock protein HslJ
MIAQAPKLVTGMATYRERIALPPNAVLEATLEDVSKNGAPAEVIGRTRLEQPGQPPFPISIEFQPSRIIYGHTYSVRVRITVGDELMFITDQAYPVLTGGRGTQTPMMMLQRASGSASRTEADRPVAQKREMTGMFRYMADAATFTDCESNQRWPVAMEGEYKALEAEYLKASRQPAEEVVVNIEGQVEPRPSPDGGRSVPTLVVARFINLRPNESCGAAQGAKLEDTDWKLTRIGDKPIPVAANKRQPNLIFNSQQSRAAGFSGCNQFSGEYKLNADQLTLGRIASTMMACTEGMDIEDAFLEALQSVSRWKASGQQLELYDAAGTPLLRFEARAVK